MTAVGKVFAGICAIFFVISGVLSITLFNVERNTFSSETYKAAFKEQGLYDAAPSIFTDMILLSLDDSGQVSLLLSVLDRNELENVISSLMPSDEFETLMNHIFDSFFQFINGDTDTITISLLPIKQHIVSEGGTQAFMQAMLAQPECSIEQALQITLGFLSTGDGLIFCRPPQEVLGLVTPMIQSQLQVLTSNIPDDLTLSGNDQLGLIEFRSRLDKVRAIMKLTVVIPLFMLIGIILFTVRSLDEWLRWWGIPFVITGIISALFALIGAPVVRYFIQVVLLQGNKDMPAIFLNTMSSVAGSLVGLILRPVAIEGVILVLIGAGMLFGANFISKKT